MKKAYALLYNREANEHIALQNVLVSSDRLCMWTHTVGKLGECLRQIPSLQYKDSGGQLRHDKLQCLPTTNSSVIETGDDYVG